MAGYPPAIYRTEVYIDGELAPEGTVVDAYVGNEASPRVSTVVGKNGIAIVQVPVLSEAELRTAADLSFGVNGKVASEAMNVDMTLAAPQVRLDTSSFASPIKRIPTPSSVTGGITKDDYARIILQTHPDFKGGQAQFYMQNWNTLSNAQKDKAYFEAIKRLQWEIKTNYKGYHTDYRAPAPKPTPTPSPAPVKPKSVQPKKPMVIESGRGKVQTHPLSAQDIATMRRRKEAAARKTTGRTGPRPSPFPRDRQLGPTRIMQVRRGR